MICTCGGQTRRCSAGIAATNRAHFQCVKCGAVIEISMGSISGRVNEKRVIRAGSANYVDTEEEFLQKLGEKIVEMARKDPKYWRLLR